MRREPHEVVATVLVDPAAVRALELELATRDLWLWPVATAGVHVDGARAAYQLRRRMIEARRGEWNLAWGWLPVFISFGGSWRHGDDPLPWAAHAALWDTLAGYTEQVRYRKWLGGVPPLVVPAE